MKVLGTPLGELVFVSASIDERIPQELRFLEQLEQLQNPQSAWLMLSMSAVPRANHMIRMLPLALSHGYAEQHGAAIWT